MYDKSQTQCYNCQKIGHYASECRFVKNKVEAETNYLEQKDKKFEIVLLARGGNEGSQENTWYLDTGASNHMCEKRSMFVDLDESISGNVSFGDNSKTLVKAKGKILIRLKDGRHEFISNVYYVPNMKNNIMSLGQLLKKGYDIQ